MAQNLYIELEGISNADITDEEAQTLVEGVHRHISEDTDAAPEHVSLKYDDWGSRADRRACRPRTGRATEWGSRCC